MLSDNKKSFIELMLNAEVLSFGEFTLKSGRIAPYFINTGNYKTGRQIFALGEYYAELINKTAGASFDAMFGPAYKGIPLVVSAAGALYNKYGIDKPYLFNRKEQKDHGEKGNLIGYTPKNGDNIIIVEDVITAGTAVRETVPLLKNYGVKTEDMFISVDRCEKGKDSGMTAVKEIYEEFGIKIHSIVTVKDLYNYLKGRRGYELILPKMEDYMDTYCVL